MKRKDTFQTEWRAARHTREAARQLRKNMTPAEQLLWQHLRRRQLGGWYFRRQHPLGEFIVDFYGAKARLIIEIDGPIHDRQADYDRQRSALLERMKGHRVIRFSNDEVMNDLESVLFRILEALEEET